ncbi:MAG: hypothetical protein IT242_00455 [Bacteroidia bacterium]|nr:hypothetical protein [Bacteroidia bacterium]
MKKYFLIALVPAVLTTTSCSNSSQENNEQVTDTTRMIQDTMSAKTKELIDFKFFYTIANLPSPMEIISAIYQNNVPFNKDLLNPTTNESRYNTTFKKAINYGVYGIDMAYAAFYGQNQDLLSYYATTRKVAERLNVQETFDAFTESFQENSGNRDSLVKMIDRAYSETDSYLRNNNRLLDATHVLAGAIIEVQYLSLELMKNLNRTPANEPVFEKIYNQKLYVENLISLLTELKKNPETAKLLAGVEELKKSYDTLTSPADLTRDKLEQLSVAVAKVRTNLIG